MWNPLPIWSLPDARTSVLAGCFHFTLSHSCCPFFFAKVCLVASGLGYILSSFLQCNFRAISWQTSSNGDCQVDVYVTPKLLFHWFIAFLSQASLPQVGTVWTYSRIGTSTHFDATLQCINIMHPAHNSVHERIFPVNAGFRWQSLWTRQYAQCHLIASKH